MGEIEVDLHLDLSFELDLALLLLRELFEVFYFDATFDEDFLTFKSTVRTCYFWEVSSTMFKPGSMSLLILFLLMPVP